MKAKILWVEGKRVTEQPFIPVLRRKGYLIETVSTGNQALELLEVFLPDLVVVNAASMRSNGKRICYSIRQHVNGPPILLIANPDKEYDREVCANLVLELPFTSRKLTNRILRLLPSDGEKLIRVGAIRLDTALRKVKVHGRETRLTPRLIRLLSILIENRGSVIEREELFRRVWDTDYTGDTRTLDVHISWLRQAIEDNPKKPIYLKTIRGIGYRLDP